MAITDIRVGEADFSLDEELSRIMRESPSAGGVASFVGLVRNKNDGIVLCLTSAEHRSDAFAGCEYIMDWLKTEAPFWKKEQTPDGERWVDARESDDKARERWLV